MNDAARRDLLRWYRSNRRDLPWRRSRDPYAIWVSEVMLQQTRVEAAVPYFERWMARFPTVAALAVAPEDEVLAVWSGLGYYSRARNLHHAAQAVVSDHGGRVPDTFEALQGLPGVGDYTAGAVASIAFGRQVPAVDGNVMRVACRVAAIRSDPAKPATRRRIRDLAAGWVPRGAAGDWNQALMELGATVCSPRSPRCGGCPVAHVCEARRLGLATRIPAPRRRKPVVAERHDFAAIVRRGRILLVRNPPGLLGGLWSLPGGPASEPLATAVRRQTGYTVRLASKAFRAKHEFSHRTWSMRVRRGLVQGKPAQAGQESAWIPVTALGEAALSTAMRTALAGVGI